MKRFILLFILSLGFHFAFSQIVYTDVNPDTTVNEFLTGYGIDFNHDDKLDVHIVLLDNVGVWVMMLIPDNNTDVTNVVYDGEEVTILEKEDYISDNSPLYQLGEGWGGLLYGYWENDGAYGNWVDTQEDKYIGINFHVGYTPFYAWINISTIVYANDDMEFTVHAYAYNSVPYEGIEAGDTGQGVAVDEIADSQNGLFPNPATDYFSLQNTDDIKSIRIYDITGKTIKEIYHFQQQQFDISDLIHGLYFVNITTTNNTVLNYKLVVE